jgi:hypothetical protein
MMGFIYTVMCAIGLFHISHSFILTIYPFLVENLISDILYINYYQTIMVTYTYLNGECPISFFCKNICIDGYKAGDDVTNYLDIYIVIPNKTYANTYIVIMTTGSLFSLFNVIYRFENMDITNVFVIDFIFLLFYFAMVHKLVSQKIYDIYFAYVQEICKIILVLSIGAVNLISYYPNYKDYFIM